MALTPLSSKSVWTGAAALAAGTMILAAAPAGAADWSDTALSLRHGSKFAEPFNTKDVSKDILGLTHVSGYKYGTNFLNVDFLNSDKNDPTTAGGATGAQEAYLVYRNTVSLSKLQGSSYASGLLRDVGITAGFDWNTKNDVGYASKKRMLVLGPTLSLEVPGFLNAGILILQESNAPLGISRYSYKTHPALDVSWGLPIGKSGWDFEGYAMLIAAKGKDEFGGNTKAETHFDGRVMYDAGAALGGASKTFKVGFEYEWWKNKFGNDASGPAGKGAFAKTPMIRAEYHF